MKEDPDNLAFKTAGSVYLRIALIIAELLNFILI